MTHLSCCFICSVVLFIGGAIPVSQEYISKSACIGDTTQLFENITIDSHDMIVSLTINASKPITLALWEVRNATVGDKYLRKVFLDKSGDIWIRNVSTSDQDIYTLTCRKGRSSVSFIVNLNVLVAPTIKCKPKINRVDDIISASLETENCGKPLASVYWLDYPGIYNESKDFVRVSSKTKPGTYYACIEGPALTCAKTSKFSRYCSAFTIEDIHETISEPGVKCNLPIYPWVIVAVSLVANAVLISLLGSRRNPE